MFRDMYQHRRGSNILDCKQHQISQKGNNKSKLLDRLSKTNRTNYPAQPGQADLSEVTKIENTND